MCRLHNLNLEPVQCTPCSTFSMSPGRCNPHDPFPMLCPGTLTSRYTDVLPKRYLGRPAYFISHCWSNRFYDLTCNVFRWFRSQADLSVHAPGFVDLDNTFVWMDVFAIDQHQGEASSCWATDENGWGRCSWDVFGVDQRQWGSMSTLHQEVQDATYAS